MSVTEKTEGETEKKRKRADREGSEGRRRAPGAKLQRLNERLNIIDDTLTLCLACTSHASSRQTTRQSKQHEPVHTERVTQALRATLIPAARVCEV